MLTPYHQQNPTPNAASDLPLETVFSRQAENVVIFSWVFGPRLYIVLNNKTLKRADTHTLPGVDEARTSACAYRICLYKTRKRFSIDYS